MQCYGGKGFAMVCLYNGEGYWAGELGLTTMDLLRIECAVIWYFLLDGKFVNSNNDTYRSVEWLSCIGLLLLDIKDLSALSF